MAVNKDFCLFKLLFAFDVMKYSMGKGIKKVLGASVVKVKLKENEEKKWTKERIAEEVLQQKR